MKNIFEQNLDDVVNADFIPIEKLKGKTLFVTGATGLIGHTLVSSLIRANEVKNTHIKILALVRNIERARERFKNVSKRGCDAECLGLHFVEGSVEEFCLDNVKEKFRYSDYNNKIDYIVHGASNTSSMGFIRNPVETIETAVIGTRNMLEVAKYCHVEGFVYLSSMEVYGHPAKGHKVTESEMGGLSSLDVRNSYPISKQLCEAMCIAYYKEYGLSAKIIRLAQTFGPDVSSSDGRIFAYLFKCVNEKKNIVLKTKGESERSYLTSANAATAVLAVLLNGENGTAYNAAQEESYCSISKMAEKIAEQYRLKVVYEIEDEEKNGFPQVIYMDMDTSRLRSLGWHTI